MRYVTVQYSCLYLPMSCWKRTMELLSHYKSSTFQSESSDKEFQPAKVKSIYLITYSQAVLSIFSDRQLFADAICDAVLNCKGPKVVAKVGGSNNCCRRLPGRKSLEISFLSVLSRRCDFVGECFCKIWAWFMLDCVLAKRGFPFGKYLILSSPSMTLTFHH